MLVVQRRGKFMTIRALPSAKALQLRGLTLPSTWRYVGGKRDLRLDLLRGFAALAMVVDHVGGEQSWLYWITGGGRLWVSAAELFVLIAGLTMGIVYGAMAIKVGITPTVRKTLGRASRMYLVTVALTFAFVAANLALGLESAPQLTWSGLPVWALEVVTLRRTFFLVDIPFMYTVLIALAGPVLYALWRGWTWQVLAASWALWAAWQFAPGTVEFPWPVADNGMFHLAAWQVIFVNGVAVGHHRDTLLRVCRFSAAETVLATGAVLAVMGVAWATQQHPGGILAPDSTLLAQLYDKPNVPFGRVVMLGVSFAFLYSLITVIWQPLAFVLSPALLRLGQNSLLSYGIHLFVVAALAWALPTTGHSETQTALIQLLGITIVWLAVAVWTWRPNRVTSSAQQSMPLPTPLGEREVRAA
jgi:hypothetical protein